MLEREMDKLANATDGITKDEAVALVAKLVKKHDLDLDEIDAAYGHMIGNDVQAEQDRYNSNGE